MNELYVVEASLRDKCTYLWPEVSSNCYSNSVIINGTFCIIIEEHEIMKFCVRVLTTGSVVGWCTRKDLKQVT